MKLSEFAGMCGHEDLDICIEIEVRSMGPTPTVGIKTVHAGFDWDKGKLIIVPDKPLIVKEC